MRGKEFKWYWKNVLRKTLEQEAQKIYSDSPHRILVDSLFWERFVVRATVATTFSIQNSQAMAFNSY